MRRVLARWLARQVTKRPVLVALLLVGLVTGSGFLASTLVFNSNQLDLIPQDLPSVKATKQMIDVRGGVGFLLIALKGNDSEQLKQVADDLAGRLRALKDIRRVTYRQDVDFVRERIGLYIETEDLKEAYKRIRKKIRATIRAANPFHITLRKKKEQPLDLSDLVDKYKRINKKGLDDPYYFDPSKKMLLLVLKPNGNANDLPFVRDLLKTIDALMEDYNADNSRNATLVEHYGKLPDKSVISYGYTGGYKRNLDDSDTIQAALVPTSLVAFVGILVYLLLFMRRPLQIILIMSTLAAATIVPFAFCRIVYGELNTITSMLAAILLGMGIDFGILFLYRLREEYSSTGDLLLSIEHTIEHSGTASLTSALTTASALCVLALSQFDGFAHFGIVASVGVLTSCLIMYSGLPVAYVLLDRAFPRLKDRLVLTTPQSGFFSKNKKAYPFARTIVLASVVLTAVLFSSALHVQFDYDGRSIMTADRPSIVLQEEINDRYDMSADPVGIFCHTLEEAKAIYDALWPIKEESTIDSVVSLFRLVPSQKQQQENVAILQKLKNDLGPLKKIELGQKESDLLKKIEPYLEAKPFTLKDVPEHILEQFKAVPESQYQGYVTFVYPKVSIWDSRDLVNFATEIGTVRAGDKTYHSAGMAVLYADLASIVLKDGRQLTILAVLVILTLMLVSFRKPSAAIFAMLPLLAGMVWMLGLMKLTGWRINYMNIVVFPVVFGYGISGGIQLYHRYVESQSVWTAVRHTGMAVIASSMTTLIGWSALLVSQHRGLESMGVLACLGIASSLMVSLTILPALLQVRERWIKPKAST